MTICLGIDPGSSGALATFDSETGYLSIQDIPTWWQTTGKRKRQRYDMLALKDAFEMAVLQGVELVVLEAVGGRPKQSASAAFVFGYGVGLLYASAVWAGLPVETVPPSTWKAIMRVPKDEEGISHRFGEIFPQHRGLIEGGVATSGARKGQRAIKHDRAEAALLAMFGARHVQQGIRPNQEWRLAYQRAETGA